MWIPREIFNKIRGLVTQYPILILTGARQTGKTSLFKRHFPEMSFVSLDLPSHAELAEKDPETFLKRFPPPVIIDEVQYAPALFRYLKFFVDQNRDHYGQFLLTGSQKYTLMKNISESLAGRCVLFELDTLSFLEIQNCQKHSDVLTTIVRGGFPELHARTELETDPFYNSYLATYLERDVRSLLKLGQLRDFERFIRVCALRSAQLLNKSELAKDVGISPSTANEWLSVLEASNQIHLLEPWFENKTKSLIKSPKLYFGDSGLLCHLLGITTVEELEKSPLKGAIWESFVFLELKKRFSFSKNPKKLWLWRDRYGLESDFLIHKGGRYELYEAKFSENPNFSDVKSLLKIEKVLGTENIHQISVICRTKIPYPLKENIIATNLLELKVGE